MLVRKARPGESLWLHGCGDEVIVTLVEVQTFEARVQLVHAGLWLLATVTVDNPLVIRIGGEDVELCIERLFGNAVRWSVEAPPVIAIDRLEETIAA